MKKQELEERLINFSVDIIKIVDTMPEKRLQIILVDNYYVPELPLL